MSTLMDTNINTVLSEEEKKTLKEEVIELLEKYHYSPTHYGVEKIIDRWIEQKGWLIELMKKHPNYVEGKYMIAFKNTYERRKDKELILTFINKIESFYRDSYLEEYKYKGFSWKEIENSRFSLNEILDSVNQIEFLSKKRHIYESLINQQVRATLIEEFEKFLTYYHEMQDNYRVKWKFYGDKAITTESHKKMCDLRIILDYICTSDTNTVEEILEEAVNTFDPSLRAKKGQKISRLVNKLCKKIGFDKTENYDKDFAKFADTINPLEFERHTIISCNLVDYLTMSFGNSWASCHTIDKLHEREDESGYNYNGCYSAGTLSYALDNSSVVFYTVDDCYSGTDFELEDKVNRCMFHLGEDKLVQGRVYPQCEDSNNGIYATIRNIAQEVFATCLDVPNLWYNVKGKDICTEHICSNGMNYKDYYEYDSCNVSFLKCVKNQYGDYNHQEITVGELPICPSCGEEHDDEECIECSSCHEAKRKCFSCGAWHNEDDMYEDDGNWYCENCTFYCDYHERMEIGEPYGYYRDNERIFCAEAINYGTIQYCEECDEFFDIEENGIRTEDGGVFCCERCAEEAGYIEIEGRWYNENDLFFCEECNGYVLPEEYDTEKECCEDCAAQRQRQDVVA